MRYAYYPIVMVTMILGSIACVNYLPEKFFIATPLILTIVLVLLFIFGERILPYRKEWNGVKKDSLADFLRTLVVLPWLSKLTEICLPILFYYPVLWVSKKWGMIDLISDYGYIAQITLALLCCEFCYYWFHRLAHNWRLLWRLHSVHHGVHRVYWLNAGSFHSLEIIPSTIFYFAPLLFFEADPVVTTLIITISSITGFLEHINVNFEAGWLNYVFNTAQHHRWHHSKLVKESNSNYGKALIIWDLLFRSFHLPKGKDVKEVGVQGRQVPIDFIGQMKHPFEPTISED